MIEQIIKSIISYLVPAIIGFLVAKLSNYKKKNDGIKEGLKTLLQSNISNSFFYYEPFRKMPDYLYRNILNQFKAYKDLDGNDYVDSLMDKMKHWEITRTDILNKEK